MNGKSTQSLDGFLDAEAFNKVYLIAERQDGRWDILAFDSNLNTIGLVITVNTSDQAWKLQMLLSGRGYGVIESSACPIKFRKAV